MAQQRPRLHRHRPPVIPPRYTLRQVVWAVVGFLLLISIFVVMTPSSSSRSSPSSSSIHTNASTADSHDKRSYRSRNDIPIDVIMSLDAILVLGGGVPESIDKPPIYVQRRCDDAVVVSTKYHDYHRSSSSSGHSHSGKKTKKGDHVWLPILCLSAGTAHLPQLIGPDGYPIWESTASANYILQKIQQQQDDSRGPSLPSDQVFVETTSYDTIGNAYFTRTSHTDINGWRNLLVITDEFHMDRTKLIFDWIFGAALGERSDKSSSKNDYKLTYLSTPNVGLSEQAITARTEREQSSAMNLRTKIIPNYSTLREIYTFITQEHSLYNAVALSKRGRGVDGTESVVDNKIKQSYGVAKRAGGGGESGSAS